MLLTFRETQEAEFAAIDVPVGLINLPTFVVAPDMVVLAARKLKCSFAVGPDGLPAVVLCRCITSLSGLLSKIFNRSFESATFPAIWKQSYMCPIFKKGDRRNIINYRDITSLSAFSKLFEIIVSDAL